jgi:hypothetical protein
MENIIKKFWKCSLQSNFANFDFDEAFDEYRPYLQSNCVSHGLGSFEEYCDYIEDTYGLETLENEMPDMLVWEYITFFKYDAMMAALKAHWEAGKKWFETDPVHGELAELLEKIQPYNLASLTEPQLITLFDECIHAEHCNGLILDGIDLDDLRQEAEEEYQLLQEKYATDIRAFLV